MVTISMVIPGHPRHEDTLVGGIRGPDLYQKTIENMRVYRKHGFKVMVVWEHNYDMTVGDNGAPLESAVEEFDWKCEPQKKSSYLF